MEFKELYKKEMEEIKHNPELDRTVIDRAEHKMKSKRRNNIIKVATLAAVFAIVITVNAGSLVAYAESLFFQYQLQVGKASMNLDDVIPVDMHIDASSTGREVTGASKEESYDYIYKDEKELLNKTGLKLCNSDNVKFGEIRLGVSEKYHTVHMVTEVYYKTQKASMNGMFVLDGFKGKEWGYGDTSGRLISKYKYADGKYAYFISNKDYDEFKMQVVYFTDKNIMYQLFVDQTEEGTELAENIIDGITKK